MSKGRLTGTFEGTRSLEDAFFLQQDQLLVERQRQLRQMAATKDALAQASGIDDDALLQRLVELGIQPQTVAALSVVPLIEVAWADGDVDDAERAAVLAAAQANGIAEGSIEHSLLSRWLERKPGPELLDAWTQYVGALCGRLDGAQRTELKQQLLGQTRAVAEASGGILGIGKVSGEEKKLLVELEECFNYP